ncbi:ComF family protein [Candidatus Shapirobacteria bacterium]|nr:ComF family protein [Candidatus Shapirobacteria bacterium]
MPFSLLDFLYPRHCLFCGREGSFFCPACFSKKPLISFQICPICQHPSFSGQTHPSCQTKFNLNGLISLFSYPDFSLAIKKIKYRPYYFAAIEELMSKVNPILKSEESFWQWRQFVEGQQPVVIPLPLASGREKERGFNQAELMARFLASFFKLSFDDHLLWRTKETRPQSLLKKEARKANVKDAFAVLPGKRCPQAALLVDDVWTSGASLKNAATALKHGGASLVWGFTLCR